MAATDRRETESGIEVKPVYTAEDAHGASSSCPASTRTRAAPTPTCIAAGRGRCGSTRASPRRRSRTRATATCSSAARPGLSIAFDLPTQLGLRLGRPARARRGRAHRRRDRLARRHGGAARRDPARRRLDLDDDQRAGRAAAAALRAGGGGGGRPGDRAARDGAERHPQGVHRARELHLPAAAVDAPDDRPVRVLRGADPVVEHDLDLRLPHPRGRFDRGAGARVHARERDRLLRGGRRGRPVARRVRRAAVVLLQRAQRLLPGGGEVPRGAPAVGAHHARAVRRDEPEGASRCASTRRPAARR